MEDQFVVSTSLNATGSVYSLKRRGQRSGVNGAIKPMVCSDLKWFVHPLWRYTYKALCKLKGCRIADFHWQVVSNVFRCLYGEE